MKMMSDESLFPIRYSITVNSPSIQRSPYVTTTSELTKLNRRNFRRFSTKFPLIRFALPNTLVQFDLSLRSSFRIKSVKRRFRSRSMADLIWWLSKSASSWWRQKTTALSEPRRRSSRCSWCRSSSTKATSGECNNDVNFFIYDTKFDYYCSLDELQEVVMFMMQAADEEFRRRLSLRETSPQMENVEIIPVSSSCKSARETGKTIKKEGLSSNLLPSSVPMSMSRRMFIVKGTKLLRNASLSALH